MKKKEKSKLKIELFGTNECTELFIDYLQAQSSILMGATSQLFKDSRTKELKIVLGSITQTATSIAILSRHSFSNEATMLARSFIAKAVNFCYLMVCSEEEYQNYVQYSRQKMFRKLDRKIELGGERIGFSIAGKDKIKISPELQASLDKFTGEKGGEKTRWTKKTINKRLEEVARKKIVNTGIFMLILLSVYEDASEALHGTFYGCAFHTGFHLPEFKRGDKESATKREQKNLSILNVNCGAIITDIIGMLNTRDNVKDFHATAQENTNKTVKLMDAVTN